MSRENCFRRLKRQRDNVFSEIAETIGFARDNPATPSLLGLLEEMLGTTQEPPNVGLPWTTAFSENVALHNRIMAGQTARTGAPQSTRGPALEDRGLF
jgi:hypothetical protein